MAGYVFPCKSSACQCLFWTLYQVVSLIELRIFHTSHHNAKEGRGHNSDNAIADIGSAGQVHGVPNSLCVCVMLVYVYPC
jgi:hypothetical protein